MCSEEERALYAEQGFLVVDGIYSKKTMDECCREYDAMFARAKERGDKIEATWKGDWKTEKVWKICQNNSMAMMFFQEKAGKMEMLSIHNIQFHSATFTQMMLNPKLGDVIADLMGTNDIEAIDLLHLATTN